MSSFARWTAYAISVLIGAGFFAASRVTALFPDHKSAVLVSVAAGIAVLSLMAGMASGARFMARGALRFATAPCLFAVAAFGFFLLVESDAARLGVAASVAGLLLVYFTQLEKAMAKRGSAAADLLHLLQALYVVTLFYGFAFVFGISAYVDVPSAAAAAVMGAVSALAAWHSLPVPTEGEAAPQRRLALVFGAVGAELYLALSLLPTAAVVNAATAVILLASTLQVCRQVAAGTVVGRSHRHELVTASLLVVVVLLTARWA